jgi:hypothetical protein
MAAVKDVQDEAGYAGVDWRLVVFSHGCRRRLGDDVGSVMVLRTRCALELGASSLNHMGAWAAGLGGWQQVPYFTLAVLFTGQKYLQRLTSFLQRQLPNSNCRKMWNFTLLLTWKFHCRRYSFDSRFAFPRTSSTSSSTLSAHP